MFQWMRTSPDDLDLNRTGLNRYLIDLPYHWNGTDSILPFPVVIAHAGAGRCALLVGGTHGDEFEGQLAAQRLQQQLEMDVVQGTLIIVPTHNRPAALAGVRCSPIDGEDLNRLYPCYEGDGPSRAIARFVTEHLMPPADVVIDIHSGGANTEFVQSSNLQSQIGTPQCERDLPALLSFNAPYALVFDESRNDSMPHGGTLEAAAAALGKQAYSTELGGAGRLTPASLSVAEAGIINVLRHFDVLAGTKFAPEHSTSQLLCLSHAEQYIRAPMAGHFVPHVWLGESVTLGQSLGEIHVLDSLQKPKQLIQSTAEGIVVAVTSFGIVDTREPVYIIAETVTK